MKIYKIAQTNPNAQADPAAVQEVMEAAATVKMCIDTINKSLSVMTKNQNIANLFQRDTIINEIVTGNTNSLNQNIIQDTLDAMSKIVVTIPTLNAALKTLRENDKIARQYNMDINSINKFITNSLKTGKVVPSNALNNFNTNLPSSSGVTLPSNL